MDEIFTAARPMKVWRAAILGSKDKPGDFTSLAEAVNTWQRAVVSMLSSGEWGERVTSEPRGFQHLTDMLVTVCDVGPASINPTPLIKCYNVVGDARLRRSEIDVESLERAFERSLPVLGRLLRAWLALSGEDAPEGLGAYAYCPNESEQSIIDAIKNADRRLTTEEVLKALTVGEIEPNRSSVKGSLAVLGRAQILDNAVDQRGKGYGLRVWTV